MNPLTCGSPPGHPPTPSCCLALQRARGPKTASNKPLRRISSSAGPGRRPRPPPVPERVASSSGALARGAASGAAPGDAAVSSRGAPALARQSADPVSRRRSASWVGGLLAQKSLAACGPGIGRVLICGQLVSARGRVRGPVFANALRVRRRSPYGAPRGDTCRASRRHPRAALTGLYGFRELRDDISSTGHAPPSDGRPSRTPQR